MVTILTNILLKNGTKVSYLYLVDCKGIKGKCICFESKYPCDYTCSSDFASPGHLHVYYTVSLGLLPELNSNYPALLTGDDIMKFFLTAPSVNTYEDVVYVGFLCAK